VPLPLHCSSLLSILLLSCQPFSHPFSIGLYVGCCMPCATVCAALGREGGREGGREARDGGEGEEREEKTEGRKREETGDKDCFGRPIYLVHHPPLSVWSVTHQNRPHSGSKSSPTHPFLPPSLPPGRCRQLDGPQLGHVVGVQPYPPLLRHYPVSREH
jgi:hypothetical protein